MNIDLELGIKIFLGLAALGVLLWLYKKGQKTWAATKAIMFTSESCIATVFHVLLLVGVFTSFSYILPITQGAQHAKK